MIKLKNVNKYFKDLHVVNNVNLEVKQGEVVVICGPSGSGKSTLIRTINQLEKIQSGEIWVDGINVADPKTDLNKVRTEVGFVFQHYALFKHLTVADNIAFGLTIQPRYQRPAKARIREKVAQLLDMVQLADMGGRYPAQLSGGQQQRVALARALATEPEVILFDEPFGALDVQVRHDLRLWLKALQRELRFTGVFVTHDREEALDLADRIVVMRHGAIAQNADPQQLYADPADAQVFNFMSDTRRFPAHIANHILHSGRGWAKAERQLADGDGELALRVQDLELTDHPPGHVQLAVVIEHSTLLGANYRLTVKNQGWGDDARWQLPLPAQTWLRQPLQPGQRIYLNPRRLYFLRANGAVEALFRDET